MSSLFEIKRMSSDDNNDEVEQTGQIGNTEEETVEETVEDNAEETVEETVEESVEESVEENVDGNPPEETVDTKDTPKETPVEWIIGWLDDLVAYFVVFIIVMLLFVRPVVVDGDSMKTTLYNGDVLFLSSFNYTPQYGDIIVISREKIPERPLIKRVIAVGGDTVSVDYDSYTVYVNGEPIKDDHGFVLDASRGFGEHTDNTVYPYIVPENCVFVMGDNRGNSSDSRECGAIEYGQILGKAIFRIYRDTSKYDGSMIDFNLYD